MRWAAVVVVLVLATFLSGCAIIKIPLNPPVPKLEERVVEGEGRAKIAMVDISGLLSLDRFGLDRFSKEPPQVARFKEELDLAAGDDRVVALLVRIDSPGGSVTASDILYHELERFQRQKKVPVVACVMDKALSGGYYVALAAQEIVAHPTAVVGGVGVISYRLDVSGLLEKLGVRSATVQSGPLKDFWSPLRESRPAEVAIMQEIVHDLNRRFLQLVKENRPVTSQTMQLVASARIFDAGQALELKLVDRLGYLEDAIARARELAGVEEARVVIYRRPGAYGESIYAADAPLLREWSALEQTANELLMPSLRYQVLP